MEQRECGNCRRLNRPETVYRCFVCGGDCCTSCGSSRYTKSGRPHMVRVCNKCGYQAHPLLR